MFDACWRKLEEGLKAAGRVTEAIASMALCLAHQLTEAHGDLNMVMCTCQRQLTLGSQAASPIYVLRWATVASPL